MGDEAKAFMEGQKGESLVAKLHRAEKERHERLEKLIDRGDVQVSERNSGTGYSHPRPLLNDKRTHSIFFTCSFRSFFLKNAPRFARRFDRRCARSWT